MKGSYVVYQDKAGEWRWRVLSSNGRIVAECGEGYKTQAGCLKGFESAKKWVSTATVH